MARTSDFAFGAAGMTARPKVGQDPPDWMYSNTTLALACRAGERLLAEGGPTTGLKASADGGMQGRFEAVATASDGLTTCAISMVFWRR